MGVCTGLGYTMGGLYDKLECAAAVRLWTVYRYCDTRAPVTQAAA